MHICFPLCRKEKFFLFAFLAISILAVLAASLFLPSVYLFIIFNFLFLFTILIYLVLFIREPNAGKAVAPKKFESISFVVPAFNSKNTIKECVDSLKSIAWRGKKEIIIIDDCSTDGTREILEKEKGITLIKLAKNSGPSVAVNEGIKKAKGFFVTCVDSDSYPRKDVLMNMMGYFEKEDVAAVTCLVLPDKKNSFIQKLQHLEYVISFGLNNALLSSIGSSYVVPGPFTVFKKSIFKKVGLFQQGNLAQDMEFGLRLKSFGLKIMSCYDSVVLTDIPSNWRGLFKQRDRWYRGATFNFIKYKNLMFNKTNPDFGFFVMPFVFFTQILTIAVMLRVVLFFVNDLYGFVMMVLNYFFLGGMFFVNLSGIVVPLSVMFLVAAYILIGIYFFLGFKATNQVPSLSELPILVMLIFIYPYFLTFTYSQSYLKELLGVRAKWLRVST